MQGIVKIDITNLTDHQKLDSNYQIININVLHEINKIPRAEVVLLDGYEQPGRFRLSEQDFFTPGKLWEIKLRYGDDIDTEDSVFKGLIVKQCIKSIAANTYLTVELKSAAVKLTSQRRNVVYQQCLDSDIIKKLASTALAASDQTVAKTTVSHEQLVQHNCTDWDFIVSRADVNGLWIKIEQEELHAFSPTIAGTARYHFNQPDDIKNNQDKPIQAFEMALDISQQVGQVTSYAWNIAEQAAAEKLSETSFAIKQGNLAAEVLAKQFGTEKFEQTHAAYLPEEELSAWSNSKLIKSRQSFIKGYLTTIGFPKLHLGDTIGVNNISERFNGNMLVTGIRHNVNAEGWQMDVQFGLSADWFIERYANRDWFPAAGLLPPVSGLQIGIVEAYEEDEQEHYRVRVRLPLAAGDKPVVWARLASLYAGNERGWFFYPEPGDEVVLGFFNNDPRQPVILGAMYSAKNVPPFEFKVENNQKGLVTKKGIKLLIDEEQESLQVLTPANNQIAIQDQGDGKGISLIDKTHQQQLMLNDQGLQLKSDKQLQIESKNQLTIKGNQVDIQ